MFPVCVQICFYLVTFDLELKGREVQLLRRKESIVLKAEGTACTKVLGWVEP
jgi:hypothetical protein